VATDLTRIGEKARKDPKLVFTSLYHHISDRDNLRAAYQSLAAGKAAGWDGVTKKEYGKDLAANLADLSVRLKRQGYRPGARRRSYIPKAGSEKGRPLGIGNLEDKVVEQAVKRTLEPIYETVFQDSSYGYRPQRSPHDCLDKLGRTIQQGRVNWVVEADIRSYFDRVNHEWLVRFLRHRIGDERVIRLIIRMLKSGILEDGLVQATELGTPQGSILSPLLSNIYLHYVLDLWFEQRIKRQSRGEAYYCRFADDYLACFQYASDARAFLLRMKDRLEGFGLEVAEEKTQCIEFGRFARENARRRGEKPMEFTFLGFTHYCGKTRRGYFKVKRRTSRKKLVQGVKDFGEWVRKSRNKLRKGEMLRTACRKVNGYLNYYAITDNSEKCQTYVYYVKRLLFKWLNRKSQRKAYTWDSFKRALAWVGWTSLRIRRNLNPMRRAEVP